MDARAVRPTVVLLAGQTVRPDNVLPSGDARCLFGSMMGRDGGRSSYGPACYCWLTWRQARLLGRRGVWLHAAVVRTL